MVTERSVVVAGSHAAILEICVPSRTDMDLSVPTSRIVPCQSEPRGKPRLTFVSDGKPRRRLLLCSKKNSRSMAVLLGWICPSHREGETADLILANRLVPSPWSVDVTSPLHSKCLPGGILSVNGLFSTGSWPTFDCSVPMQCCSDPAEH